MIMYISVTAKAFFCWKRKMEMIILNKGEQYIAKIIFRNRIYEYIGQQFEDFFVAIMTKINSNFQPVKAYGNIGDKKNDGFDQTTGTYYQIFSPEDITKPKTISEAANKLEKDFIGLFEYWNKICQIKQYYFVINDKYKGVPAPIIEKLSELKANPLYKNINIAIFSAKDLESIFDKLDENAKQDVVGFVPDNISPIIEFDALNEVVSYLVNTELRTFFPDSLVVPDFDEKIIFNNLSNVVNHLLVVGSYQEGRLLQYFNETPGTKEILQKRFRLLYEQAKVAVPNDVEDSADCRFFYILEQASPRKTLSICSSVLVLMAYYFSSCDIFEEPQ